MVLPLFWTLHVLTRLCSANKHEFPSRGHHILLHLPLSSASSFLTPASFMPPQSTIVTVRSQSRSLVLAIQSVASYSLSFLSTCANISGKPLLSPPKQLTCAVPQMSSFLTLSILVTPKDKPQNLVEYGVAYCHVAVYH